MNTRKFKDITDKELITIAPTVKSRNALLTALNVKIGGGTLILLKKRIASLNINTDHWLGQGHRKGSNTPMKAATPLDEVLVNGRPCNTNKLRIRLLKEGLLQNICYRCFQPPVWMNEPLVMRLDHIDGDKNNNSAYNLQIVCCNCDSQSPTFCGRNKALKNRAKGILPQTPEEKRLAAFTKTCKDCPNKIRAKSTRCPTCRENIKRIDKNPEKISILYKIIEDFQAGCKNYTVLSDKYKISDVMIKKYLKCGVKLNLLTLEEISLKPRKNKI